MIPPIGAEVQSLRPRVMDRQQGHVSADGHRVLAARATNTGSVTFNPSWPANNFDCQLSIAAWGP
jgi:hypothetical protein